jgi:hypothetical protein
MKGNHDDLPTITAPHSVLLPGGAESTALSRGAANLRVQSLDDVAAVAGGEAQVVVLPSNASRETLQHNEGSGPLFKEGTLKIIAIPTLTTR